jgi:general secretion pathway protein A
MYEAYYGLKERPFDLTANPRFLFLSGGHREALSNLQYGIEANKGITLLIGEAGTGKTTLIRAALEQQRGSSVRSVYLSNPTLTRQEFYDYLAVGFGLSEEAAHSKTVFLRELEKTLEARRNAGGMSALIVDEAQSLPHELLEEVRLLANLETMTAKLMPVVLTGQPELSDRLNEPQLRQLKQRVALRCSLPPFDLRETAAYVAKRIRIAGGDSAAVFTREAVEAIQHGSHGIARTISVICDNALINGFALQRRPVDADVVVEVCREFELLGTPDTAQADGSTGAIDGVRTDVASAHVDRAAAVALPLAAAAGSPLPMKVDRPPVPERLAVVPAPGRSSLFGTRPDLPRPALPDDGVSLTGGPSDETIEHGTVAAGTRRRRFLFF